MINIDRGVSAKFKLQVGLTVDVRQGMYVEPDAAMSGLCCPLVKVLCFF